MVDTMMLEHQEMLIFASLAPSVQGLPSSSFLQIDTTILIKLHCIQSTKTIQTIQAYSSRILSIRIIKGDTKGGGKY
jgi:hypothetical protein